VAVAIRPATPEATNGKAHGGPRVALVHDYLNQYGGAERVLEELHSLFPSAPVYTSMYWPQKMSSTIRSLDVHTSFMQRLPFVTRKHQPFLLLYPLAFESFDLSGYDVVISNSSAFAKGVVTSPGTLHISYCLTPMRWVWNYHAYVERERLGAAARMVLPAAISLMALRARTSLRATARVRLSRSTERTGRCTTAATSTP